MILVKEPYGVAEDPSAILRVAQYLGGTFPNALLMRNMGPNHIEELCHKLNITMMKKLNYFTT